jgi:hypothetical protein
MMLNLMPGEDSPKKVVGGVSDAEFAHHYNPL